MTLIARRVAAVVVTALTLFCAVTADAQNLAGGAGHSVFLTASGTVWTVGSNGDGQLGDNTLTTRKVPIQVSGLTNVVAVAAGWNHSLALKSDGTLWTWGDNAYGQLGDTFTTDRKVPVQVGLTSVVAMAAGQYHSVAVTSSGQVYVWGRNNNGQLGTGNTTNASSPTQVLASGGASVGSGLNHTLVVKTDGTVWGTGVNTYGQLGIGNTQPQLSLVQMTSVTGASKAAGGGKFSVVLLSDGTARAAGYNGSGQVGDNTSTQQTTAVAVVGLTGATEIAVGDDHTLARTSSGAVYAWGSNSSGRLGDGTTTLRRVATLVSTLSGIDHVGVGSAHSLAVAGDGTLWAWGDNASYPLGDGTTYTRVLPDTISGAAYSWRVATPTLSINSGTYTTDRNVVVTTETAGATIHYSRTGIEPTEADPTVASGGTVVVSETQTLMAKAWKAGMPTSATSSATYTMKVSTPAFTPAAGTFTSATSVSISSSTPGASFRYTLDGSEPTEASTPYTGPITIATSMQLKAIGLKTNWSESDPRYGTYTMNFGTLAPPTIGSPGGTYEGQVSVTLTTPQSGATIRYTTNGSTPTASSTAYTAPVVITTTATLKAKVFHPNYATSAEASAAYTIKVPAPTISLAPGSYQPGAQVTIASPDAAATLRVTFTGSDPTSTDGTVPSGTTLLVGGFTLKVRASRAGCVDSDVASATYVLTEALGGGAITAGATHTVLATPQGLLLAWGNNQYGRLGDGTTTQRTAPTPVPTLTGVTSVAAGDTHTLALTWDGRLFAWGYNNNGRLGDGTVTNSSTPVHITALTNVVAIAAGATHSMALTANGSVYTWGVGTGGQLGNGSTASVYTPTVVAGLANVVAIAAGDNHSLAVTNTGQLYAWGTNSSGQLGLGNTTTKTTPNLVTGLANVVSVRAGGSHSLAIVAGGAVYAWGANGSGQLGLGNTTNATSPTVIAGLTALDIDAADLHSLAVRSDGVAVAWGHNSGGKLGDGTTTMRTSPTVVTGPGDVALIAGGDTYSVAVTSAGHVWSWGSNTNGQLGDGTTTGNPTPADILTSAGTWGGTPAPQMQPLPGTYDSTQTFTISAGSGVTVHYTTTGVAPTEADPVLGSSDSIAIDGTMTIAVRAWSANRAPSATVIAAYQLQPATPTASVPGGLYTAAQTVSLQGAAGADIRYTLDGTVPSETSPLYAAALTIAQTATLRARAFRTNWTPSPVLVAAYQIVVPVTNISLVAPANGAAFDPPASFDIQAFVTSNVSVTSVSFYEGSTLLGTVNGPPYRLPWSASTPGVYTLTATATDQFSTVTTASPVAITVRTLPVISDASPATGSAGTLVTITGSDFGATQGTSSVWLGTKVGVVETWADGLITARIAAGASSGTAQVRLPDRSSNTMPITVLTPVISNATPGSGGVGTAVTISGSNFGSGQGTGQVWLGTAAGAVTSWSATQIVATIAAGSQTGSVQVLQNGVASNSVPLTITGAAPKITGLSPTQGAAGTVVTLYGSGFGSGQGGGQVRLGNSLATVGSWSDTQVSVSVPTGAMSGVVKLQQSGLWSNPVMFRVPATAMGSASVISPVALSMVVGEMRTLQALDDDGELVTGATWASSDTDVVSLSTADPPVLTAVAPGTVTISVGDASAEVTVYSGPSLPLGTVVWTNGASTAGGLYPAVPNYDAVADVFAVGANDEVTAITADGSTAWVHQGLDIADLYPDFQGGAVIRDWDKSLWRLDPLTGEPLHLFSHASPEGQTYGQAQPRIHQDGTVFVVDFTCTSTDCSDGTDPETGAWVVGIDSKTAATKFRVKMQNSTDFTEATPADELFCQFTGGSITQHAWVDYPWAAIIAGDGYYYVPYRRYQSTGPRQRSAAQVYPDAVYDLWDQLGAAIINSDFAAALAAHAALRAATGESYTAWHSQMDTDLNAGVNGRTDAINLLNLHYFKYLRLCDMAATSSEQLRVLRVGPDGASTDIAVKTWESTFTSTYTLETGPDAPWGYRERQTYSGTNSAVASDLTLITDSDQGVLMSWIADERCGGAAPPVLVLTNTCVPAVDEHLTLVTNGAVASDVVWGHDLFSTVRPVLQLEDGSFLGARDASGANTTVAFELTGNVKWAVSGVSPWLATDDGGFIAESVTGPYKYSGDGVSLSRMDELPPYSWRGNAPSYSGGVVTSRVRPLTPFAPTYASMEKGGATVGTSVKMVTDALKKKTAELLDYGAGCRLGNERPGLPIPGSGPSQQSALMFDTTSVEEQEYLLDLVQYAANNHTCFQIIPREQLAGIAAHIPNLMPFDGTRTTTSQFNEHLFVARTSQAQQKAQREQSRLPVCELFIGRGGATLAMSGRPLGQSAPPENIFVTSTVPLDTVEQIPNSVYISSGGILHEAAHSFLDLTDLEMAQTWGPRAGLSGDEQARLEFAVSNPVNRVTVGLTRILEDFSCAIPQILH